MEAEESANLTPAADCDDDFYIESDCCLLCGVPEAIAPEIFETGELHCFVKRQPRSKDEVDRTLRAMWSSEVDCVRYRGHNKLLLRRLAQAGMPGQADHPLQEHVSSRLRDAVSFSISTKTDLTASASQVASAFRADLRAGGTKVLPAILGRKTVWLSWYQNHFHRVRFSEAGDGARLVAHLKSNIALQGLALRVDDWLRAKQAENITWCVESDAASVSSTPM